VDTIKTVGVILTTAKDGTLDYVVFKRFYEEMDSLCAESEQKKGTLGHLKSYDEMHLDQPNVVEAYPNSGRQAETSWRIPCADQIIINGKRCRSTATTKEVYKQYRQYLSDMPGYFVLPPTGQCQEYFQTIMYQYGQRTFISHSGYVGLAPGKSEPGDSIYIVLGANIPFVFREHSNNRYQLIGEAYVDGIMDGEFMVNSPKLETIQVI
jgi:hypothetical protein